MIYSTKVIKIFNFKALKKKNCEKNDILVYYYNFKRVGVIMIKDEIIRIIKEVEDEKKLNRILGFLIGITKKDGEE